MPGVLGGPGLFGRLHVGVGPVVDLLLDELAGVEGPEGRAREVEVELGHDGQVALVYLVARVHVLSALALAALAMAHVHDGAVAVVVPLPEEVGDTAGQVRAGGGARRRPCSPRASLMRRSWGIPERRAPSPRPPKNQRDGATMTRGRGSSLFACSTNFW